MTSLMKEREQEVYITYPITPQLVQQAQTLTEQIREGNMQSVEKAFQTLIQIVDLGVTSLVREPKKRLKFNLVVDKTLNGVINMTTHLGYKRLEKLGMQVDQTTATHYINHFWPLCIKQHNLKDNRKLKWPNLILCKIKWCGLREHLPV